MLKKCSSSEDKKFWWDEPMLSELTLQQLTFVYITCLIFNLIIILPLYGLLFGVIFGPIFDILLLV